MTFLEHFHKITEKLRVIVTISKKFHVFLYFDNAPQSLFTLFSIVFWSLELSRDSVGDFPWIFGLFWF